MGVRPNSKKYVGRESGPLVSPLNYPYVSHNLMIQDFEIYFALCHRGTFLVA